MNKKKMDDIFYTDEKTEASDKDSKGICDLIAIDCLLDVLHGPAIRTLDEITDEFKEYLNERKSDRTFSWVTNCNTPKTYFDNMNWERIEDSRVAENKLFITEIINSLHRHNCHDDKAMTMLQDWSRELREEARTIYPATRLRLVFNRVVGKECW